MLPGICGRRAKQAGLRMGDEANRDVRHALRQAPLGDKARRESGSAQMVRDPGRDAAGDSDPGRAVRQRQIASHGTERQAEVVERFGSEQIAALDRQRP